MNQFDILEERSLPPELYVLIRAEVEVTELTIDDFSCYRHAISLSASLP
jgi:hypothetical protein